MLIPKIYLYQLSLVLFALTAYSIELSDKIHSKVCDKIDDGKFRGELIKCMKMMPLEIQIVWRSCGAQYFNSTKRICDFCEIITEMCANPTYAQNVTSCVENFEDEHSHHDLSLDLDFEGHEHSHSHDHNHDHSGSMGDDESESEEEMHVVYDLSVLISKECLKSLFSSYNITIKEDGKDKE